MKKYDYRQLKYYTPNFGIPVWLFILYIVLVYIWNKFRKKLEKHSDKWCGATCGR